MSRGHYRRSHHTHVADAARKYSQPLFVSLSARPRHDSACQLLPPKVETASPVAKKAAVRFKLCMNGLRERRNDRVGEEEEWVRGEEGVEVGSLHMAHPWDIWATAVMVRPARWARNRNAPKSLFVFLKRP